MKLLFTTVLLALSAPALACKCMVRDTETLYRDAEEVYLARYVKAVRRDAGSDDGLIDTRLRVIEQFKGKSATSKRLSVHTSSAACGVGVSFNQPYLMFVKDGKTTICAGSRPLEPGEDETLTTLRRLRDGKSPDTGATEPAPTPSAQ